MARESAIEDKLRQESDIYRRFYEENNGPTVVMNGRRILMFGSVNYLCMTHHPRIIEVTVDAIRRFGAGAVGSRFSNGSLTVHRDLDDILADFMGKDAALVFNSGYMANLGVISAGIGPDAIIFSDKENHLSIFDGCKLSGAKVFRYKHNDMEHLETFLKRHDKHKDKWIVAVGTFGVSGETIRIREIVGLAEKYGAHIYLDDAHEIGLMGSNLRGLAEENGVLDQIDLIMASFQMAFGNVGAFVCGKRKVIETLRVSARPYIFSYGLPVPSTFALIETCKILRSKEGATLVNRLWRNVDRLRETLKRHQLIPSSSDSQIVSALIADEMRTITMSQKLLEQDVWAQTYLHPAVPPGRAALRFTCMASHQSGDFVHLDNALRNLGSS